MKIPGPVGCIGVTAVGAVTAFVCVFLLKWKQAPCDVTLVIKNIYFLPSSTRLKSFGI